MERASGHPTNAKHGPLVSLGHTVEDGPPLLACSIEMISKMKGTMFAARAFLIDECSNLVQA
jgi:hypothetical protein